MNGSGRPALISGKRSPLGPVAPVLPDASTTHALGRSHSDSPLAALTNTPVRPRTAIRIFPPLLRLMSGHCLVFSNRSAGSHCKAAARASNRSSSIRRVLPVSKSLIVA